MSMNVFNASGMSYLGPQAFAFDRTKMLAGLPAAFVSPVGPLGGSVDPFLPADLDGPTLPPSGAPATFVGFPGQSNPNYTTYHFHADFATPANSTFTIFASPAAAGAFNSISVYAADLTKGESGRGQAQDTNSGCKRHGHLLSIM